jgi:hypothetical protein
MRLPQRHLLAKSGAIRPITPDFYIFAAKTAESTALAVLSAVFLYSIFFYLSI